MTRARETEEVAAPADPPGARLTVYVARDTAERIDLESRRLHYEYGGVSRSRLVGALVDVGFAHLAEVEAAVRSSADHRHTRSRGRGRRRQRRDLEVPLDPTRRTASGAARTQLFDRGPS
jgi:hypothetical protein